MPVTVKQVVTITPTSGAKEVSFEKNGPKVMITVIYDAVTKVETTIAWNMLWSSTFLKDKGTKIPDTKVRKTIKQTKTATSPSIIKLDVASPAGFGEVSVATGDLRKALLAIK